MRLALGEFPIVDIKETVMVIEITHRPEILFNCVVPYAHNHKIGDLIPIYIWVEPKR
jgi:hypothetical protein